MRRRIELVVLLGLAVGACANTEPPSPVPTVVMAPAIEPPAAIEAPDVVENPAATVQAQTSAQPKPLQAPKPAPSVIAAKEATVQKPALPAEPVVVEKPISDNKTASVTPILLPHSSAPQPPIRTTPSSPKPAKDACKGQLMKACFGFCRWTKGYTSAGRRVRGFCSNPLG